MPARAKNTKGSNMIISITGTNTFLMQRRLEELRNAFIEKYTNIDVERLEGEEADGQAIVDAVQGIPFLSSRKMVIVRGLGFNKAAADHIEQIIDAAAPTTELIFYEPVIDKRTAYFKTLKSKTKLEEYGSLGPPELAKWLVDEAKN